MTHLSYILAFVSVVSSAIYVGYYQLRAISTPRVVSKALATGGLAAFALSAGASLFLVAALALATVADVVKSNRSERGYITSMGIFLIIHALMIAHFYLHHWVGVSHALLQGLALSGMFAGYLVVLWPFLGALKGLVIPYIVMMLALVFAALGSPMDQGLLKVGAIIYLISNGLLGLELIVFKLAYQFLRIVGPAIWICYYVGLGIIVIGSVSLDV